jgi:hypothetical protein
MRLFDIRGAGSTLIRRSGTSVVPHFDASNPIDALSSAGSQRSLGAMSSADSLSSLGAMSSADSLGSLGSMSSADSLSSLGAMSSADSQHILNFRSLAGPASAMSTASSPFSPLPPSDFSNIVPDGDQKIQSILNSASLFNTSSKRGGMTLRDSPMLRPGYTYADYQRDLEDDWKRESPPPSF